MSGQRLLAPIATRQTGWSWCDLPLLEAHARMCDAASRLLPVQPWRVTMRMLSEDDLDLRDMTGEELDAAWDLWFDLAQSTNEADPPYTHGVFAGAERKVTSYKLQVQNPSPQFLRNARRS